MIFTWSPHPLTLSHLCICFNYLDTLDASVTFCMEWLLPLCTILTPNLSVKTSFPHHICPELALEVPLHVL